MLGQRRRRWANIEPILANHIVFDGIRQLFVMLVNVNPCSAGTFYIYGFKCISKQILKMIKLFEQMLNKSFFFQHGGD